MEMDFDSDEGPMHALRRERSTRALVAICCYLPQLWIGCICLLVVFIIALRRNYNCDPGMLAQVEPPYAGELLPNNFTMIQRPKWMSITKQVDVYDAQQNHIGYFYDMNFLFFMRFGYSDASDQIWFEARKYWFWDKVVDGLMFGDQYWLRRCDVGSGGKAGNIYDVNEDFWGKSFFCWWNCVRHFWVRKRPDAGFSSSVDVNVADVKFGSSLEMVTGWGIPTSRHAWHMEMTDPISGAHIAKAQQHFSCAQTVGIVCNPTSIWHVAKLQTGSAVPNWVVGFMAALDDIEEKEDDGHHR